MVLVEQKADRAIRDMDKEMKALARLMGIKTGIGTQRQVKGGLK